MKKLSAKYRSALFALLYLLLISILAVAQKPTTDPNVQTTVDTQVLTGNPTNCHIADTFPEQIQYWEVDICRWSDQHQIDPDVIATLMTIESCGNQDAVSFTGVKGLFQVTGANMDGLDPFNPDHAAAKGPGKVFKAEYQAAKGNFRAAMAGYNGGRQALKWISGQISRGQFYWFLRNHSSGLWWNHGRAMQKINEVERYTQWASIYTESKQGRTDTFQKWLDKGGSHLCDQATIVQAQYGARDEVLAGAQAEK